MHIGGTANAPSVVGKLQVVRGTFSFSGRRLDLADTSTIQFNGPLLDPDLNISADTTVEGVTATSISAATPTHPQITFTSTPTLPQDEVLSRLLFGSLGDVADAERRRCSSPPRSTRCAVGRRRARSARQAARRPGLEQSARARRRQDDRAAARRSSAGKYISNSIYVEVITDAKGFTQTQLTIAPVQGAEHPRLGIDRRIVRAERRPQIFQAVLIAIRRRGLPRMRKHDHGIAR